MQTTERTTNDHVASWRRDGVRGKVNTFTCDGSGSLSVLLSPGLTSARPFAFPLNSAPQVPFRDKTSFTQEVNFQHASPTRSESSRDRRRPGQNSPRRLRNAGQLSSRYDQFNIRSPTPSSNANQTFQRTPKAASCEAPSRQPPKQQAYLQLLTSHPLPLPSSPASLPPPASRTSPTQTQTPTLAALPCASCSQPTSTATQTSSRTRRRSSRLAQAKASCLCYAH